MGQAVERPGAVASVTAVLVIAVATAVSVIPVGPLNLLAVFGLFAIPLGLVGRCPKDSLVHGALVLLLGWIIISVFSALWHPAQAVSTIGQLVYPVGIALVAIQLAVAARWGLRVPYIFLGVGLGIMLGATQTHLQGTSDLLWVKSGYGQGVVLVLFAIMAAVRASPPLTALMAAVLAVTLFLLDFRSAGLIVLLVGILVLLYRNMPISGRRFLTGLVVVLVAMPCVSLGYSAVVSSGLLGEEAKLRFTRQADSESGLILAARPEFIAANVAIRAHPLVGRGAQAQLTLGEQRAIFNSLQSNDLSVAPVHLQRLLDGVNAHSFLLQSWIANGVLGLVPPLGLLTLCWCICLARLRTTFDGSELFLLSACWFTWDVFFSPWNLHYESWYGAVIGLGVLVPTRTMTSIVGLKEEAFLERCT